MMYEHIINFARETGEFGHALTVQTYHSKLS